MDSGHLHFDSGYTRLVPNVPDESRGITNAAAPQREFISNRMQQKARHYSVNCRRNTGKDLDRAARFYIFKKVVYMSQSAPDPHRREVGDCRKRGERYR